MAFKLQSVVPWGRTFAEYKAMFNLSETDLSKNIASFGDGPASFNCEGSKLGYKITSFDPLYQFDAPMIKERIKQVRPIVMTQMEQNQENYIWKNIRNLSELEQTRMSAMNIFLEDFEVGKTQKRYIYHELPDKLYIDDNYYDIGLSSHFLLMYTDLGYKFHISAINEMLRVCKEIRIFPIVDLEGKSTGLTAKVVSHYKKNYDIKFIKTSYEFQKGGNSMLVIKQP